MHSESRRVVISALGIAAIVAVWWLVAKLIGSSIIVPTPIETIGSLLAEFRDPVYYRSILATLNRTSTGFAVALILGAAWGLAAGLSRSVDRFMRPALILIRATPVIALILLALIWFHASIAPAVVTLLMVLPVVTENIRSGVRESSGSLLEMARVYRFGRWTTVRHIVIPSLRPYLVASAHAGFGMAYKVAVAAEAIIQPPFGLGSGMQEARFYLDTPRIIALTITVVVLSGVTDLVIGLFNRTEWRPRPVSGPVRRPRNSGQSRETSHPTRHGETMGALNPRPDDPRPGGGLAVRGLSKAFHGRPVLADVEFTAEKGRITVLLGPSGCGKTTLLRVIAGLEAADSGDAEWHDTVSFVFQEPRLLPWRSVQENLLLPLRNMTVESQSTAESSASAWLDRMHLSSCTNDLPGVLSGGMEQRVSLARAFVYDGRLFLLDEPFQNLDIAIRLQLWSDSRRLLAGSDRTVVFVTHDLVEAVCLADTLVVMSHGPARVLACRSVSLAEDQRDPRSDAVQHEVAALYELLLSPR